MDANALDHVALWVADRDRLAEFAYAHLGMHEIERTDDFTLVGADARRGKLTLFAADGPRDPVRSCESCCGCGTSSDALTRLPGGPRGRTPARRARHLRGPEGLGLGLVSAPDADLDYDIDHVVLRVPDPAASARAVRDARVRARRRPPPGGRQVDGARARRRRRASSGRLLNHIALLVDSGQEQLEEAERRGLDVAEVRDAREHVRRLRLGPRPHQARVRRAQARFRTRLAPQTRPRGRRRRHGRARPPPRTPRSAARACWCSRRATAPAGRCCSPAESSGAIASSTGSGRSARGGDAALQRDGVRAPRRRPRVARVTGRARRWSARRAIR